MFVVPGGSRGGNKEVKGCWEVGLPWLPDTYPPFSGGSKFSEISRRSYSDSTTVRKLDPVLPGPLQAFHKVI